jgi:hypothetical protein
LFTNSQDEPMRFQYRIFERSAKSLLPRSGTKRPAPSMMDDPPPDDDAAPGPRNNRPPMTSTSPSSKMPRLSERDNSAGTGANSSSSGSTGKSSSRSANASALALSAAPVYEFSESTDDYDFDVMRKSKPRGYHRLERNSQVGSNKRSPNNSTRPNASSSSSSSALSRSQSIEGKSAKAVESVVKRSASTSMSRGRSSSVGNSKEVDDSEDEEDEDESSSSSDSREGIRSKNSDSSSGTTARLRSAAQQVMQSQMVNGNLKFSLSPSASGEKKEPLKLSLLGKSLERRHHKHRHHKMKHKEKNKSVKLSINLNSGASSSSSNSNQSMSQSHKLSGKEVKFTQGKSHGNTELGGKGADGKGNSNASGGTSSQSNVPGSVKTATSAHLSAISKSISVSIGGVNMQQQQQGNSNNSGNNVTSGTNLGKGHQANKILSPTELLPKNTGIEIQPTTIPPAQMQHHHSVTSSSAGVSNNQSVSARTHPLLPDSVHVPKSVTLIPVNPNTMNSSSNGPSGRGGNSSGGNAQEKSGSSASTSSRFNAHTFTHPITNKSLHQITVTEVPPPSKCSSPGHNTGSSCGSGNGNIASANTGNHSGMGSCGGGSSSSLSSSNPIEKVIANVANNKPQFNGPGSMEITKIYCGMKENPAKKLKERKGLDISISVPGINVSLKDKAKPSTNLSSQKLEESLRQKIGNSGGASNKIKASAPSTTAAPATTTLLNARMPPGITIGPAGISKNTLGNGKNPNSGGNSNNAGSNNTIKGLGFTLPPHITAHPQLPPGGGMKNPPGGHHPSKANEGPSKPANTCSVPNLPPSTDRSLNKDPNPAISHHHQTISNMNRMKAGSPSTMETLMNGKASGGSKSHMNRKHLGEALASMLEMASRNNSVKSPSPPKNMHSSKEKSQFPSQSNRVEGSVSHSGSNPEKRAHPMDTTATGSPNRKNSSESPEPKRPRGGNESKSSSSETPLDLSGRSSRPGSASDNNSSSPILGSGKQPIITPSSQHPEKSKTTVESTAHPHQHSSSSNSNASPMPSSHLKHSPTSSLPKTSPPTTNITSRKSTSPSSTHKSHHHPHHHHNQHHQHSQEGSKKPSSSSSPNTNTTNATTASSSLSASSSSILSIAQSLAQKQLQQQQQQNLHNQIMQLHQGLQQHMQHSSHGSAVSNQGKAGSMGLKGSSGAMGLSSLSPPMIPMANPSPPGPSFDPLRNLLTLSDAAVRQGKMHPMNNLMAAVGLCPPPPPPQHNHGGLVGALTGSAQGASHTHPGLFSHLSPHLANSLGAKSPTGILDPGAHAHLFGNLAALSAAHNERLAAAAGINHFGSSLSPPLSLPTSFYSGVVRPPSSSPHGGRIPGLTPKVANQANNSSSNNSKKGSTPPVSFSHPPTTLSNANSQAKHPSSSPGLIPVSNASPSSSFGVGSGASHSNSTHSKPAVQSSSSSSTASMNSLKNIKINGTLSNPLPLLPPGIHNPLLPIYTRTQTSMNNSKCSSPSSTGNASSTTTSMVSGGSTKVTHSDKKGIPNSMKISNFLPSKPKDGKTLDRNVEATITSGSNVGGSSLTKFLNSIPPLIVSQTQPNLSVSTSPKDSSSSPSRLLSSTAAAHTKSDKECISVFPTTVSTANSSFLSPISAKPSVVAASGQIKQLETTVPITTASPVLKSIKNEPTSPTSTTATASTISSKMNSNVALFSHSEISPTPKAVRAVAEVAVSIQHPIQSKVSSPVQIKSEQGEVSLTVKASPESSSTTAGIPLTPSAVGVLSLSSSLASPPLSSATSSSRATQPQNQAVRHIPNPSLLFNRQMNNTLVMPICVSAATSGCGVVAETSTITKNSSPLDVKRQESPLGMKIDEQTLQVPAIPCPGVSVPVQVKVDNDALPIPIPVEEAKVSSRVKEEQTTSSLGKNEIEMNVIKDEKLNKSNEVERAEQSVVSQVEMAELPENKEEIMKIEYSLDDADQDIDVGTETAPIFPTIGQESSSQDCIEEKVPSPSTTLHLDEKDSFGNDENIVKYTVGTVLEKGAEEGKKDDDSKYEVGILKEGSANEEKPLLLDETSSTMAPLEETEMEIENADDESGKVNTLEKGIGEEEKVETAVIEVARSTVASSSAEDDVDVGMDEPMEVHNAEEALILEPLDNELEENEKVKQDEHHNSLSCMEIEGGNILEPQPEMEIVEENSPATSIIPSTVPVNDSPTASAAVAHDNTTNLIQMECNEESVEPTPTDIYHEMIAHIEEKSNEFVPENVQEESKNCPDQAEDGQEGAVAIDLGDETSEDIEMLDDQECIPKCEDVLTFVPSDHSSAGKHESTTLKEEPNAPIDDVVSSGISSSPSPPTPPPLEKIVASAESQPTKADDLNLISDSHPVSNQISITREALQVEDMPEEKIPPQHAPPSADLKEDCDSINALAQSGVELDKLMESSSSSSSQLEIDSYEKTLLPDHSSSNSLLNQVVAYSDSEPEQETKEEMMTGTDSGIASSSETPLEKESSDVVLNVESNECPPPTTTSEDATPATTADSKDEEGEDKSQNIITIKPKSEEEMNSISTEEKVVDVEIPTETCASVAPSSDPSTTMNIPTTTSPNDKIHLVESSREKIGLDNIFKPALISATATITTATTTTSIPASVTSTVEIKLGIPTTSITSSISNKHSPQNDVDSTAPVHNITNKIDETFEKVAAGIIASAASSINNNNNTSLSITPPTCDITITTSNANAC